MIRLVDTHEGISKGVDENNWKTQQFSSRQIQNGDEEGVEITIIYW